MMALALEADAAPEVQTETGKTPATAQPSQTTEPATVKADEPPAAKPEEKPESKDDKGTPFEKSKKDAERKDKSWKALDAEKAEFRAEKARIDAELAALRQQVAQVRPPRTTEPGKDKHGNTVRDYEEMAKDYDDKGQDDLAALARKRAAELKAAAPENAAAQAHDFASPQFQAKWQENVQALTRADATLAAPDNPVTKAANALVNDPNYGPLLRSHPHGITAAVEVARLMQAANQAQAIQAANTKLQGDLKTAQAEIDRLTKLTTPRRSLPGGPAATAQSPEEMDSSAIRAIAAAADRGE